MRVLLVGPPRGSSGGVAPYLDGIATSLARGGAHVAYAGIGGTLRDFDRGLRSRWVGSVVERNYEAFTLRNPKTLPIDTSQPVRDTIGPSTAHWKNLITKWQPDIIHVHSFAGWPGWSLIDSLRVPVIYSCHEYVGLCQRGTLVNRNDELCSTFLDQSDCHWCVQAVTAGRKRMVAKTKVWVGSGGLTAIRYAKHVAHNAVKPSRPTPPSPEILTPKITQREGSNPWLIRQLRNVDAMNRSVGVLAVSNSVKEILQTAGVDSDLVSVEHIGSPGAEALTRTDLPALGGEIRLLFHAGFVNYKGGHVLLEAMNKLPDHFKLNMIGTGAADYLERLKNMADNRVSFGGRFDRRDLNTALENCHAVVAPMTGPDTSPQTVLEALSAGRPVIGSRIGGIPDFVRHGVNGLLVEPGDPEGLAVQLKRLNEPNLISDLACQSWLPRTVKQHTDALLARYSQELDGLPGGRDN